MFSNRDLRNLLIPLIIEQVLTSLMGIFDTLMVSNVGSEAISGVSLVDSINKLLIYMFSALTTGGTIVCAQYLGCKDKKSSDDAAQQMIFSSFLLSVIFTIVCVIFRSGLLSVIYGTVSPGVMEASEQYFFITAFTYPLLALFYAGSALYRAARNSKLPMIISVISNVINVVGNAILIFVFHMGVRGAAVSTLISCAFSAVFIMILLKRPGQPVDIGTPWTFRINMPMIKRVMTVGIPNGIENAMFQFGKLVVQSTVSTLGTAAMAANAIVISLELMTSIPSMAIGIGLTTVAGQCMGAGKPDEARFYTRKLTIWALVVMIFVNWGIMALTPLVTKLGGLTDEVAEMTIFVMLVISIIKPFLWPSAFVPAYGMRAAGDVKYGLIVTTVSMWVFRVGLTTILCRFCGVGLIGIWCGYFVDWGVRGICFITRFRGDKWTKHHVI